MKIPAIIAIGLAVAAIFAVRWGFGRYISKATDERSVPIGALSFSEERIVVSDPGYSRATVFEDPYSLVVENALAGDWEAILVERKFRDYRWWVPCELLCKHSAIDTLPDVRWITHKDWIGVDSGRAGVFLASAYANSSLVPAHVVFPELWTAVQEQQYRWDGYCSYVMQDQSAAVVPKSGFVSQAGHGDGSYPVHLATDKEGRVVGIRIVFINEYGRG